VQVTEPPSKAGDKSHAESPLAGTSPRAPRTSRKFRRNLAAIAGRKNRAETRDRAQALLPVLSRCWPEPPGNSPGPPVLAS
jgi:hypothetical protein